MSDNAVELKRINEVIGWIEELLEAPRFILSDDTREELIADLIRLEATRKWLYPGSIE